MRTKKPPDMSKRKPAELHGVLCIDKPLGWTSRDVVNKVGHLLGERRCGHAGTLDPDASGLLLVAFGEAGKAVRWIQDAPKTYETIISLGTSTTTDDAAGEVVREVPVPALTEAMVRAALPWPGTIEQIPPQVSALQTDGVRDHQRVRRGEVVVRPARPVWLGGIEVLEVAASEVRLRVTCGAGFYIRSLARDLGEALGTAGHVKTLRRVHNGGFAIAEAVTIEALLALEPEARRERVVPVVDAIRRVLPVLRVSAEVATQLRQGKTPFVTEDGQLSAQVPPDAREDVAVTPEVAEFALVLAEDDTPVCLARLEAGLLRVERGFSTQGREVAPSAVADRPAHAVLHTEATSGSRRRDTPEDDDANLP
jgi:tRNA pseudouridine55 synthase